LFTHWGRTAAIDFNINEFPIDEVKSAIRSQSRSQSHPRAFFTRRSALFVYQQTAAMRRVVGFVLPKSHQSRTIASSTQSKSNPSEAFLLAAFHQNGVRTPHYLKIAPTKQMI
jgi:hypothetical protein